MQLNLWDKKVAYKFYENTVKWWMSKKLKLTSERYSSEMEIYV